MKSKRQLWYQEPATYWESALPLGNGALGAMVFGHPYEAVFQLNEDSLWYGGPRERVNPSSQEVLPQIRERLLTGELEVAEQLAHDGMYGTPMSQGHYEPLGHLKIQFETAIAHHSTIGKPLLEDYTDYRRTLDLSTGIHTTTYKRQGIAYERTSFISAVDQVMVLRIKTDAPMAPFRILLDRYGNQYESGTSGLSPKTKDSSQGNRHGWMKLAGATGGNGPQFSMVMHIVADGQMKALGEHILVSESQEVIIYLTATTSIKEKNLEAYCNRILNSAVDKRYEKILEDHRQDHQRLFDRVEISLGDTWEDILQLPTDQRLARVKSGEKDEDLMALYFQYGRYLLMGCSRPGTMPANLQGIWNQEMTPPWGCKYTININTQMNYWPAEIANLSECHIPLFDHLLRMLPRGQKVARDMYDCRGFVAHHNTDIYGDCAPQDQWMPATIWPMGGAWLALHIMEHYRFTLDKSFLAKYGEVILEAALFYLDYMMLNPLGEWVTGPSTSPENTYILENGQMSALCYGPTMDTQLIRQLFGDVEAMVDILDMKLPWLDEMREKGRLMPETKLGSDGRIMEWSEEYEEWEPGHRHISHLYGLYPGYEINSGVGKLMEGARRTLEGRLSHGGGHTGWSRAWIINLWARLLDGEKAYENVLALLTHSTEVNLFDMHPPFQIDGNFGGTAGIGEMLVQSHEGLIRLLPALPKAWTKGSVRGLVARGCIEIAMKWSDHKLTEARFKSAYPTRVMVGVGDFTKTIELPAHQWIELMIES